MRRTRTRDHDRRPPRPGRSAIRYLCPLAALLVAAALLIAPSTASGEPAADAGRSPVALSDADKRHLMIETIERFVPHAESYWKEDVDPDTPWTGHFDAAGPGVTQPRGAGNVALAYATLLVARPRQERFGGVGREVMLDHVVQTIRHEAHTNALVGGTWGGGTWQAALEAYGWGYAARLLWDQLDPETRDITKQVITGEADILLDKPPATATSGNTGAEDNGWNAPLPTLAAAMFPEHANRAAWEERTQLLAMNASSRAADEQSTEIVDGRPVSEWVETVNLFDDFTLENHGFFNPIYLQVAQLTVNDAAVIGRQAGRPTPEALSFRFEEVWRQVLGPLASDDGDFAMPAGQDWTSKDYQHLGYLSALATRMGRADASVAESRALESVARRQASHDGGTILGQPALGYESMLIKRLAMAWWTHELFGPSPQPTAAEYAKALRETAGTHEYPDAEMVTARQRDALVTMSWGNSRPTGLIVSAGTKHADDPVFASYLPGSATGSASGAVEDYSCDCQRRYFSTAGSSGARDFSMTSFPDGMTMLLDRGRGRTFSFGFELIPGVTGPRPVHSADGVGTGRLSGTWANVADRFGMLVAGGDGFEATEVTDGNPHLRLDGSRAPGNITASSSQSRYPPELALDGDPATFWVSSDPATPQNPQWLEIDLGEEREISDLSLLPRPNRFGPRDVVWQVPDGDGGWRDIATVVADRATPTRVTVEPVTTRRVRLLATSGYDHRNIQVAEVRVGEPEAPDAGNRGAVVYPLVSAAGTEQLNAHVHQPEAPDGWSALLARSTDGSDRLALARWSGAEQATLELRTDRGAPILDQTSTVEDGTSVASFELDAPESQGQTIQFYARSDAPVRTRAVSGDRARLANPGSNAADVVVTFVDGEGDEHTASGVLPGGGRVDAVFDDDQLRLVPRP